MRRFDASDDPDLDVRFTPMLQAWHESERTLGGLSQQVAEVRWQHAPHDDAIQRPGTQRNMAVVMVAVRFADQHCILHSQRSAGQFVDDQIARRSD